MINGKGTVYDPRSICGIANNTELHDVSAIGGTERIRACPPGSVQCALRLFIRKNGPGALPSYPRSRAFKNLPVYDALHAAIASGVPVATTSPPACPPSGPRSITWSAVLITSR